MMNPMPYRLKKREVIFAVLDKFPNHGNRTLAQKLYADNPEFFSSVESARTSIRMYRGALGDKHRTQVQNRKYYKNVRKPIPTT
jgi:hypothetical protein